MFGTTGSTDQLAKFELKIRPCAQPSLYKTNVVEILPNLPALVNWRKTRVRKGVFPRRLLEANYLVVVRLRNKRRKGYFFFVRFKHWTLIVETRRTNLLLEETIAELVSVVSISIIVFKSSSFETFDLKAKWCLSVHSIFIFATIFLLNDASKIFSDNYIGPIKKVPCSTVLPQVFKNWADFRRSRFSLPNRPD